MILWHLDRPFAWPSTEVAMASIPADWWGEPWSTGARHALVVDPSHLWFLAADGRPAQGHPSARCGDFQDGLWQYDVAEWFIRHPQHSGYLEFNLSPRGAWWAAAFASPRQRIDEHPIPHVLTHAGPWAGEGWQAAMGIPLDFLKQAIGFGHASPMNVTFILNSPQQRFFSASPLGSGQPDFHQPDRFTIPEWRPLEA